jgi:adenylate cyclase
MLLVSRADVAHAGNASEFAEGLSEELRAQIARMCAGTVAVISRSSSIVFDGQLRRASEIGERCEPSICLKGASAATASRVRITASLVETIGETHVWSDTVERNSVDALSQQVEVAARIARSLTRKLLSTP